MPAPLVQYSPLCGEANFKSKIIVPKLKNVNS